MGITIATITLSAEHFSQAAKPSSQRQQTTPTEYARVLLHYFCCKIAIYIKFITNKQKKNIQKIPIYIMCGEKFQGLYNFPPRVSHTGHMCVLNAKDICYSSPSFVLFFSILSAQRASQPASTLNIIYLYVKSYFMIF